MCRNTSPAISSFDDWLPSPDSWPIFACQCCEVEMRLPFPPSDRLCEICRAKENPVAPKTLEQRLAAAGAPRKYASCTRRRWQQRHGPWSEVSVLRGLVGWPHDQDNLDPSSWLVFIVGHGHRDLKTELGTAVLGEAISRGPRQQRGRRGRWLSQRAWLRDTQASWHRQRGSVGEPVEPEHVVWSRAADAEVLLLDDFGGGDGLQSWNSSWWRRQVTELLHHRESHLLPTIVTANLTDWRQVERVHESLIQRMDVPQKIVLPSTFGETVFGETV